MTDPRHIMQTTDLRNTATQTHRHENKIQKRDLRREALREDEAALPDDRSGNMSVSRCSRNACKFLKSQLATTFTISNGCNTLQHTATHCNTLQHTATHDIEWL